MEKIEGRSNLHDYRVLFLIAFIIGVASIIPYGIYDDVLTYSMLIVSGALFMVGIAMFLEGQKAHISKSTVTKTTKATKSKKVGKLKVASAKKTNTRSKKSNLFSD